MTRRLIVPLLLALTLTGCASTGATFHGRSTAQLTTPGVQALHTLEVVKLLDVVRDTAIDGDGLKVIPTATAVMVVQWHKDLIRVIRASADGWKSAVLEACTRLLQKLTPAELGVLGPYLSAALNTAKAVL